MNRIEQNKQSSIASMTEGAGANIPENVSINVNGLFGKQRNIEQDFFYIGQAFYQGTMLSAQSLYSLICDANNQEALSNLLIELSGFYAFILNGDNRLIAACDRTRSRPLFYALDRDSCYLSDSAQWIVAQLTDVKMDSLSEQELAQAGYVSGNNTLVKQLKQIPAGSYLYKTPTTLSLMNYYHFLPMNNDNKSDENTLYAELDEVMKQSIEQLITYANGRQLVVPLSGGYDSRSIATYLKAANYTNIITFTFGKASSKEVMISKSVADALSFEWHVVEYTHSLWKNIKNSQLFNQYLSFISSYVSVPNVQVYPAIKLLVDKGVIDNNAVIVPGHTGDFISGGHIPMSLIDLPAKTNVSKIVEAIINRHYRNKTKVNNREALVKKLSVQVQELMDRSDINIPAISIFEAWEFAERQAKFIVNSNRYYDFFNLDWWMPLWHNDMVAYWENVPLKYRIKSNLWQKFVEMQYQNVSGDKARYGNVSEQYHPKILRIRTILDYFTDENGLYALVPFYRWLLRKAKYPYANGTLFSHLAAKVINKQKKVIEKS
jgi:asparagine synthase (glutamine-hydrolysing)